MEFHAAATLFPMMENTAIKELAEDIAKNGQIEPILTVNGKIIDGRNRFEACKLAGVEPVFEEYQGDTSDEGLLKLSLSLNMKRRHLDASQKAMLAVTILPLLEKEAKQRKIDALKNLRKKPPEKCEKSITSDEDSENTITTRLPTVASVQPRQPSGSKPRGWSPGSRISPSGRISVPGCRFCT